MDNEVIELAGKRLESLIVSAGSDIATATEIAEQAATLASVSAELSISAQRKLEDIYILLDEQGKES